MHLFGELSRLGSTAATKAALELIGEPIGPPRLPRLPLSDAARTTLRDYLTTIDLPAGDGLAG